MTERGYVRFDTALNGTLEDEEAPLPANLRAAANIDTQIGTATQAALDLKAPIASPTFTGTVGGVTKSMVGLGNVDNTSDANKPISTATQEALDLISSDLASTASGKGAALVGFTQTEEGAYASTALRKLREWISPQDFGAIADGSTHPLSERYGSLAAAQAVYAHATALTEEIDWAATQAAINAGRGRVYFPEGTYVLGTKTVELAGNVDYVLSGLAIIEYTGSSDAFFIDRKKNIQFRGGQIDISGAGTNAVGIHATGVWFLKVDATKFVQGPASSGGIWIEPYNGWGGSYIIDLCDLDMVEGAGAFGIKISSSDASNITHCTIRGGWIHSKTDGVIINSTYTSRIIDTVCENVTNGVSLSDCSDIYLQTGEISASGDAFLFGADTHDIKILQPSTITSAPSFATFKPSGLMRNELIVKGSTTQDNDYYAILRSIFNYGKSVTLVAKGGGSEYEILQFGDAAGLTLNSPTAITLSKNGTAAVTLDTNGRIGVGTTSPSTLKSKTLHLSGTTAEIRIESTDTSVGIPNSVLTLKRAATRSGGIAFTDGSDTEVAFFGLPYNAGGTVDYLVARTAGSERLRISSAGVITPGADNTQNLGSASLRLANAFATNVRPGAGAVIWTSGSGTPEAAVTAPIGSLYTRTDGGASTTLYVKESGAGNTGWVAK